MTSGNAGTSNAWKIVMGVSGALAGVGVILLMLWLLLSYALVTPQVAGVMTDKERYDLLAAARAEDQQRLKTYGWVDSSKGTVRIPIDQAMQRLVEENRGR